MRVRRALYGLATGAACLLPTAFGDAPPRLAGGDEGRGEVEREVQTEAAINEQLMLAERCGRTEHAAACGGESVMMFAETMFGGCSPVGCFRLEGAKEGAIVLEGDHGAAVRTAIVQQRAAWLADEEARVSVGQHFLSLAVGFHEDEARSKAIMRKLLKKRRGKRDMLAIADALDDATNKGYAHAFVAKASDVVQWATSPATVVLRDQASASPSDRRCTTPAAACGTGSTAIVARRGRGRSCGVAGCIDVSAEDLVEARVAAVAGDAGQEKLTLWAEAMEKEFPFVTDEADLVSFNKRLAAVAEGREEERRLLNEVLQIIIQEGHGRDGLHDYGALRFFAELAQHKGFVGSDIDAARLLLAGRSTSTMIRRVVNHAVSRATTSLVAVQRNTKARSAKILRQGRSIRTLEGDNARLRTSIEQMEDEIAASGYREEALFVNLAARQSQLDDERRAREDEGRRLQAETIAKEAAFASELEAKNVAASIKEREQRDEIAALGTAVSTLQTRLTASQDGERSARETLVLIQAKLNKEQQAWEHEGSRLQAEKIAKEAAFAFASELEAKNVAASIKEREQRDEIAALGTAVSTLQTRLTASQDGERSARETLVLIQAKLNKEQQAWEHEGSRLQAEKIAKEAAFASELEAKNVAASIKEREQRDEIAALGTAVSTLQTRLTASQEDEQAARGLITAIQVDLAVERAAREEVSNQLQNVSDYAQSLAGDLMDCHTFSMALERDVTDERATAANQQQWCIEEVASLMSSLSAQGASQVEVESLLAASKDEVAGLRLKIEERAIAAEDIAQQLRSALERETKLGTSVKLLEEEAKKATVELSDCRTRVKSLVDKGSACEAEREARALEVVALRGAFDKERDKAAAVQRLADSCEETAKSKAKAVVDHEAMANSLKLKLGTTIAEAEAAERKAEALEEEVAEVEQENEIVQDELDRCWNHIGDLNYVTSDFLSFMADKVHAARGHVELFPKPELGRALGTHEAYKSMRAQLSRVRLAVGSLADGVMEEQTRLRERCGPCDCVDGTSARDDVEGDGEDAQGGITSTTV